MAISNNDGNMQIFTGDNVNNGVNDITGWKPQQQIWNMFTFRYNGTAYSLFNNAVSNLTGATTVTPVDNTAIDFILGGRTGLGGPELKGKMDECSIFSGELTDADVTALYNSSSGRVYPWNNDGQTYGIYSDRQGWTPQTGNQITNITITADNSSGGNIRFRSNSTNASLDTSAYTILANGTSTITLNLGANNNIFYQFDFNGTGTGLISTYTINELLVATSSSCTYDTGTWTVQGSEKCGLNTTSLSSNNLIFNGTGQIRILQNITNCGNVTLQNGVDVTVTTGARLC